MGAVEKAAEQWAGADMLARTFHETYERLAPGFNYETRPESAVPWEDVPEQNKALMRAVCTEVYPWVCAQLVDVLRADVDRKQLADAEADRDTLRAERDRYEKALRQIKNSPWAYPAPQSIARAALEDTP